MPAQWHDVAPLAACTARRSVAAVLSEAAVSVRVRPVRLLACAPGMSNESRVRNAFQSRLRALSRREPVRMRTRAVVCA